MVRIPPLRFTSTMFGLLLACGGPPAPVVAPPVANIGNAATAPTVGDLRIDEDGLTSLTAETVVDVPTLQALYPDVRIERMRDGSSSVEGWRGNERLFFVVAQDGEPGGVFNVHVTSSAVPGPSPSWRVGTVLTSTAGLTGCECWGEGDPGSLTVCFAPGKRLAVAVALDCGSLDRIVGLPVAELVWQPTPLASR